MKLEGHNVLRALINALFTRSSDLPTADVDGVKCVADEINNVIRTGEGKEQRWFEVRMRDVTPRKFRTYEEQLELDREHADWWLVQSTGQSCFVRNRSRSGAIEDFLHRFPAEKGSVEAELARCFEFIDDEGDRIRESAGSANKCHCQDKPSACCGCHGHEDP